MGIESGRIGTRKRTAVLNGKGWAEEWLTHNLPIWVGSRFCFTGFFRPLLNGAVSSGNPRVRNKSIIDFAHICSRSHRLLVGAICSSACLARWSAHSFIHENEAVATMLFLSESRLPFKAKWYKEEWSLIRYRVFLKRFSINLKKKMQEKMKTKQKDKNLL